MSVVVFTVVELVVLVSILGGLVRLRAQGAQRELVPVRVND